MATIKGNNSNNQLDKQLVKTITHETFNTFMAKKEEVAQNLQDLLKDDTKELDKIITKIDTTCKHLNKRITIMQQAVNEMVRTYKFDSNSNTETQTAAIIRLIADQQVLQRGKSLKPALQLYFEAIQIFQKLKLYNPEASLTLYGENGMRMPIGKFSILKNIEETVAFKREAKKNGKGYNHIIQIGFQKSLVSPEIQSFQDYLEDSGEENKKLLNQILDQQNEFNMFRKFLVDTYNGDKGAWKNKYDKYVPEAYEMHYQKNHARLKGFSTTNQLSNFDISHFGGYTTIWKQFVAATGKLAGYLDTDVANIQVKKVGSNILHRGISTLIGVRQRLLAVGEQLKLLKENYSEKNIDTIARAFAECFDASRDQYQKGVLNIIDTTKHTELSDMINNLKNLNSNYISDLKL